MNWGIHIKRLREERHLTQDELSKQSGLTRSHISQIERGVYQGVKESTLKRLAQGLDMTMESLTSEIYETETSLPERPEDLLHRALTIFPDTVPIYNPKEFTLRLSGPIEPSDFVYRRKYPAYKNVVGCYAYGHCLEPEIHDGDILIVDDNTEPEVGDIAVCLVEGKLHTGRITLIEDVPYLVNLHGQIELSQCQRAWLIIEVRRRLK